MERIWCEIEERKVSKGRCLHDMGGTQPGNQTCPECSYFKSLNPLIMPSKGSTIPNKPPKRSLKKNPGQPRAIMEIPQMQYKKSYRDFFKIYRENYAKDASPITLMFVFTEAVRYRVDIPAWVIKKIDEIFQSYLYGEFKKEKKHSLDTLFGLKKGKGQAPAKVKFERTCRDFQLMTTMGMLIRQGISRMDAAEIASERNNQGNFPIIGVDKVNQMYDEWRDRLQRVTEYPESPKDVLQFVSETIRKKYPNIFGREAKEPFSLL